MVEEKKFDSDVMDSLASKSRQISVVLSNAKNPGGELLSGSLLGNGVSKLSSAIQKSSNKMSGLSSVISQQKDSFFEAEAALTNEVEQIVTPKKFELSDFNPSKQSYEGGEKEDQGKEIKTGDINKEKLNEYIKAQEIKLKSIRNEKETTEQEIVSDTLINKEVIENLNNSFETEEQEYNDKSRINEKELNNINNGENTSDIESLKTDNFEYTKEKNNELENINNGKYTDNMESLLNKDFDFILDDKDDLEKDYNYDDFYYLKDDSNE